MTWILNICDNLTGFPFLVYEGSYEECHEMYRRHLKSKFGSGPQNWENFFTDFDGQRELTGCVCRSTGDIGVIKRKG